MCLLDACICVFLTHIYTVCAFAKHHIYGYKTRIYMRTKHAYICVRKDAYIGVQKMHIFAYETRIYMLASEQRVSLAGITNSMPKGF